MRYFLNIKSKDAQLLDQEGEEFPTMEVAHRYARQLVLDLEREFPREGGTDFVPVSLEVFDEMGVPVFRMPLHQQPRATCACEKGKSEFSTYCANCSFKPVKAEAPACCN